MKQEIYDACLRKINKEEDISWNDLAKKYKYDNGEQLRSVFRRDHNKSDNIDNNDLNYRESEEIRSDGTIVSDKLIEIVSSESKTPRSLLIAHGFDPELFELVTCKNNFWHGMKSHKQGGGRLVLYQSKITVKLKSFDKITFNDIDNFFENFESKNICLPKKKNIVNGNKVLEIALADVHIGNRAFDSNSISAIEERFVYSVNDIYERAKTKSGDIDKILLVPLGDIFHFDTAKGTSTSGVPMETNGLNYSEIFDLGTKLFINAINLLSEIAPLETIYIGGNHDRTFGYFLIKSLEFYFRQDENIVVDSGHSIRKFRKIGNNLVGFCHGDMSKDNIGSWLKTEARKEWGETKYSECHAAHRHSQTVVEKDGLIVRYLPSMVETDPWHYTKGYVGAVKGTTSFLWDYEKGLEEIWYTNL